MTPKAQTPIHVLQVIGRMNLGGAESMIMNLYRMIDRTKIQFDFLVHTNGKCYYDSEINRLGGNVYHVPRFNGRNFKQYKKSLNKLFEEHPEIKVVHGHIGSCSSIYLKVAKKFGCFTIAHSHSANGITDLRSFVYYIYSYPTRYIADAFFGCSTEAGIARYGKKTVKGRKYINFPNAIELETYKYNENKRNVIRSQFDIKDSEILIGTVGRISAAKNPEGIISIFSALTDNFENVKCIWIGNGELEEKYRSVIHEKNLDGKVIMTGRRNDIDSLMQGMDAMILPSNFEGLPVTIIEAQAAGLPCVISDVISKEVAITDLVSWNSLPVLPAEWAKQAVRESYKWLKNRKYPYSELKNAGYSIQDTALWLTNFYTDHI